MAGGGMVAWSGGLAGSHNFRMSWDNDGTLAPTLAVPSAVANPTAALAFCAYLILPNGGSNFGGSTTAASIFTVGRGNIRGVISLYGAGTANPEIRFEGVDGSGSSRARLAITDLTAGDELLIIGVVDPTAGNPGVGLMAVQKNHAQLPGMAMLGWGDTVSTSPGAFASSNEWGVGAVGNSVPSAGPPTDALTLAVAVHALTSIPTLNDVQRIWDRAYLPDLFDDGNVLTDLLIGIGGPDAPTSGNVKAHSATSGVDNLTFSGVFTKGGVDAGDDVTTEMTRRYAVDYTDAESASSRLGAAASGATPRTLQGSSVYALGNISAALADPTLAVAMLGNSNVEPAAVADDGWPGAYDLSPFREGDTSTTLHGVSNTTLADIAFELQERTSWQSVLDTASDNGDNQVLIWILALANGFYSINTTKFVGGSDTSGTKTSSDDLVSFNEGVGPERPGGTIFVADNLDAIKDAIDSYATSQGYAKMPVYLVSASCMPQFDDRVEFPAYEANAPNPSSEATRQARDARLWHLTRAAIAWAHAQDDAAAADWYSILGANPRSQVLDNGWRASNDVPPSGGADYTNGSTPLHLSNAGYQATLALLKTALGLDAGGGGGGRNRSRARNRASSVSGYL